MTGTKPRRTRKSVKAAQKDEAVSNIKAGASRLLADVVCWSTRGQTQKHVTIVKALQDSGLDDKVARELLPQHAFSRACKLLEDERVIDPLHRQGDEITFQFTKRWLDSGEWKYAKELVLVLN